MKSEVFPFLGLLVLGTGLLAAGKRWKRPLNIPTEEEFRRRMVQTQLVARGIKDAAVLSAFLSIPRHQFVPDASLEDAYADRPLPIGQGQTISQPYIVALMTELLELKNTGKVLEVGTGSGYQAAVLSRIARQVDTIEIIPELAERARQALRDLGISNVTIKTGDGYEGWPEEAPFDGIIVTAAPERVPTPLLDQLAPEGHLVMPIGPPNDQQLILIKKTKEGLQRRSVVPVRFVPMTGKAQKI